MKIDKTKDYLKKYAFHKFDYWERKLLGKNLQQHNEKHTFKEIIPTS